MYKIGYIEGYDSFNTMSFTNKTSQSTYFDNHTIVTIDAYYPPYYTNIIKLTRTDLDYTTNKFNFVVIIFNNIRYYYFVGDINYINEEVYEIPIIMDTIQTFMFDLKISNAVQTRECISRWVPNGNTLSDVINRDYARENVSKDDFLPTSFEYTNTRKYLIVITSREMSDPSAYPSTMIKGGYKMSTGTWIYVFPFLDFTDLLETLPVRIYVNGVEWYTGITFDYYNSPIPALLKNPYVVNMFMVTSAYLDELMEPSVSKQFIFPEYYWRLSMTFPSTPLIDDTPFRYNYGSEDEPSYTYYLGFQISAIPLDFEYVSAKSIQIENISFVKNTNLATSFNKKFIPQLIDENYIQISYGEKLGSTSFPLSKLKDTAIYLYAGMDLTDCSRSYKISPRDDDFNHEDVYNTIKVVSSLESFNLISDAWENYQATHKGSLTTGMQLQVANNLYKFASGSAIGWASRTLPSSYSSSIERTIDNSIIKNRTTTTADGVRITRSSNRAMDKVTSSASHSEGYRMPSGLSAKTDFLMDNINTVANYQINKENLEFTPDVVGQGSNLFSDILTKSCEVFYATQHVTDIEACAKRMEYYGYSVNKVVTNKFINDLKVRYYYNVIQATNITVKNIGTYNIPLDLIQDFVSRLESGIRLFDMVGNTNFLDNLQYDNVERLVV